MITRLRNWGYCVALVLTACGGGTGGGNGNGGGTDPAALASLQPYGLTASSENAGITFNWPRISGAISYNLYWATSSGGEKNKISDVTPPFNHGQDNGYNLSNGDTKFYTYTVVRAEGESAHSVELPAVPNNFSSNAANDLQAVAGDGRVQLFWTGVAGATAYHVYWKTAHGVSISNSDTRIADVTSPFVLTGLTNDTPYYFVVTAVISGTEQAVSREVAAIPSSPEPQTPLNITATPGSGQVSLTWDAVTNASSYSLLWSTSTPVTASANRIDNIVSPTYTHTGLTNGQNYYYALVALNSRGPSPLSAEVTVQPSAGGAPVDAVPAGAAPGTPMHVKAFTGYEQITLNADDDSDATRYTIYWSSTDPVTDTSSSISDVTMPYTHTGLTGGTRVYYRVAAMNRYGASGLSAQASALPQNASSDNQFVSDTVIAQITDPALKSCITSMAADYGWSYVREVDYLHCDQTDSTAAVVPDITELTGIDLFPNLIYLHLINDGTAANLSAVGNLPNLSGLTLRGMQLDAAGVESVIGTLTHLIYLDLFNNNITVIPALPADMMFLQLGSNQIADVGPLASLTALQELHLANNAIAGFGIGRVNSLVTLTQAYWITLGGNAGMSCNELIALRSALGRSVVIHHLKYPENPLDTSPPTVFLFPDMEVDMLAAGDCV